MSLFNCDFEVTPASCAGLFCKVFFGALAAMAALALVVIYGLAALA